ncbi:hypothetical protein BT63DRAFT_113193 [Microthyrium microscopicum]|uniref:Uncharacterized protein n=1 Tax=Microthyrium microscopicum TaxID=703497 RepID=A0A6A6TUU8_9PEZI|nr:hypothetical protein BT63DRAFT_113193 [Microthyrium microscopicum]
MAPNDLQTLTLSTPPVFSDADLAFRLFAFLQRRETSLDDGRRAWLRKYEAIQCQEHVLQRRMISLEIRRLKLNRTMKSLESKEAQLLKEESALSERIEQLEAHIESLNKVRQQALHCKSTLAIRIKNDNITWTSLLSEADEAEMAMTMSINSLATRHGSLSGEIVDPLNLTGAFFMKNIWPINFSAPPIQYKVKRKHKAFNRKHINRSSLLALLTKVPASEDIQLGL